MTNKHQATGNWLCEAEHLHRTRNERYVCMQSMCYALKEALCDCGKISNTFVVERHKKRCAYRLAMEKFWDKYGRPNPD